MKKASTALLVLSGLLLAVFAKGQSKTPTQAKDEKVFGTKTEIPFALKGDIYFLKPGTSKLPDFSTLQPVGSVYATELNVPPRSFKAGFPGVTDRFEWFAIDYHGTILISKPGVYKFRITSDDGTRLYLDGKEVLENDGIHGPSTKQCSVDLTKGLHKMRLSYFQGPREMIALVMEVAREGESYHTFETKNFAPAQVSEDKGELNIEMAEAILFDFAKHNLKPEATEVLADINASILAKHPGAQIRISGHTDDRGSDTYNLKLSQERAQSVADWLTGHGVEKQQMEVKGYGKSSPKVPNTTDENRARNRRVEIKVVPADKDKSSGAGE
jgi:outer membrane protein OmpA-like peptidoglycan-associated protein